MKNCTFQLLILFISFYLLGCGASNKNIKEEPIITTSEIAKSVEQLKASSTYILQPGDLVDIKVFMEEGMDRTLRISGSGDVTFPLVGNVTIAGNTVAQAERKLSSALKMYIRNPQVTMLITEYANKSVYVLGQVQKPASLEIPPEKKLTVLEAITSVGGFTDIAATSKVRVLRMQDGKQTTIDVDVTQITKQGNKAMDVVLEPGDVVFVPQSIF